MINEQNYTSRRLSIIFISILLLTSLIPIMYTGGKPTKANNDENRSSTRGKSDKPPELGIYADAGGSIKLKSINWGKITAGGNQTTIMYIENQSKTPLTLTCTLSNFSSIEATDYLSLDWDREGYVLGAHKIIQAHLTLSVTNTDAFEVFNVDIIIQGTA